MTDVKRPLTTAKRLSWLAVGWAARAIRMSLAGSLAIVFLAFIAARVSIARASDAGMHFSDELMRIGEHHVSGDLEGGVYTIRLNGQTFESTNSASARPMGEVLDFFQEQCRHHAGGLRDSFGHLDAALATLEPATGTDGAMVLRRDDDDRGYVFCVAPDHALSNAEKLQRMGLFGRSADLHVVGDLRYVAVRKSADGTQVVTAWTEGPFNLIHMFPMTGEAPGEDFGGVPRPDGSRRVLSGTIEGAEYGVNAFEVGGEIPEVMTGLDTKLTAAGWTRHDLGQEIASTGRFYSLGTSLDLVVSFSEAGRGLTAATYVVSRNIGHLSL